MMKPRAIIDLGTNTFQLLIAQKRESDGSMHILAHEQRPVSLGKGAMKSNVLQDEAMDRAIQTLIEFKQIANSFQCTDHQIVALGTSILRRAENTPELVKKIQQELGIQVEIISGIREAELIYQGIQSSLPQPWNATSLVMDIGGGSVEFILFKANQVLGKLSLEIGGLQLQSLFHLNGEYDQSFNESLVDYIQKALVPLDQLCQAHQPEVLIGAAGAFETIGDLERVTNLEFQKLTPYAYPLSIPYFLKNKALIDRIPYGERVNLPGMKMFRASIFPYANALIYQVLHRYHIPEMWISTFSLKEGYWFFLQSQADKKE
ncbi:Ppx/GppA phosphatase family protein [Aquirufa sp. OSTEICH-129A]